jgi:hypothetical protein
VSNVVGVAVLKARHNLAKEVPAVQNNSAVCSTPEFGNVLRVTHGSTVLQTWHNVAAACTCSAVHTRSTNMHCTGLISKAITCWQHFHAFLRPNEDLHATWRALLEA